MLTAEKNVKFHSSLTAHDPFTAVSVTQNADRPDGTNLKKRADSFRGFLLSSFISSNASSARSVCANQKRIVVSSYELGKQANKDCFRASFLMWLVCALRLHYQVLGYYGDGKFIHV